MKGRLFWIALLVIAVIRIIDLQRKLAAANSRGDMYRDISMRLDRELAQLRQRQAAA
ncbi:MAG: hypothetical protein KatS3mg057_1510 [Herpetosiphonaceae bacterium]|nr:MAG: hypothetical protein KatS3mg057_1510 [Herpetosiphonaceae bacterium]